MTHPENYQYPLSIAFTTKDMARSMAFYRDTLGFVVEKMWPETDPVWANLMLDNQSVMLGASMNPDHAKEYGCSPEQTDMIRKEYENFQKNRPGVGVSVYIEVKDVDGFYKTITSKGAKPLNPPTTQFYGQRDFVVEDPDGYRLIFYRAVQLKECQSCGMPLKDAAPAQMFCQYCVDAKGNLKTYEEIFEGVTSNYFMAMQKMSRPQAETATKEYLSKMPVWKGKH